MNMQIARMAWRPSRGSAADAGALVCSFLDVASTSLGRATHYNSREQQEAAERSSHAQLLEFDRDLYAILLLIPGISDRARQHGIRALLGAPRIGAGLLDAEGERAVIEAMVAGLPAQRMLKLFAGLADKQGDRVNNARTRKLILRTLLSSPRLELWSVKYRSKLRDALVHAWGRKTASFLRRVLSTPIAQISVEEQQALARHIGKYAGRNARIARECVGFVLGASLEPTLPLLVAFEAAKRDLAAGAKLPLEVLEGIRSSYHPQVDRGTLLSVGKGSLTKTQRRQVQRAANEARVEVAMDPRDYAAVDLYVYAYAMGMNDDIAAALVAHGQRAAAEFPARYQRVGVLVDASASMAGHATQALRPMAVALALRDMLQAVGEAHRTIYCGGEFRAEDHARLSSPRAHGFAGLCRPAGETSLAEGLLELLDVDEAQRPEAVFVISDGYENAPAGRFAEVVAALQPMGIEIPIYHLCPVFAAEARGIRNLGEGIAAMPVARPEALGVSFLRSLVFAEPLRGINCLLRYATRFDSGTVAGPAPRRGQATSGTPHPLPALPGRGFGD
jgi:hypothetical protein